MEVKIDPVFQFIIKILQNNIIDVCSQMADRCIQQCQFVLHTDFFQFRPGSGIHGCIISAVSNIDVIYIMHQFQSLFPADVFMQRPAKIICNVVFAVGKSTSAAKAVHNGTSLAVDAGFDLFSINRTMSLFQRSAFLQDCYFQFGFFRQLICRKYSARASAYDHNVIFHFYYSLKPDIFFFLKQKSTWCKRPGALAKRLYYLFLNSSTFCAISACAASMSSFHPSS